jgi:hypothetical protein
MGFACDRGRILGRDVGSRRGHAATGSWPPFRSMSDLPLKFVEDVGAVLIASVTTRR